METMTYFSMFVFRASIIFKSPSSVFFKLKGRALAH